LNNVARFVIGKMIPPTGSVLGAREIERRASEIFEPPTFEADQLRNAAYDLRISPEYLIKEDGTRFSPESPVRRLPPPLTSSPAGLSSSPAWR
jgi:hypothetical protein